MEDQNLKRMELLSKAQAGDANAASSLFSLCYGDLYFYALQVLGKPAQAESVVTETLVKMCSQKSTPNSPAQFMPWMMYFCHLSCRKYMEASTTQPDLGGMLENDIVTATVDQTGILSENTRKQMQVAIKTMPMEERAVLTLVYYENLPVEQVAMICGWRPQIAESFRCSALRTLKAIADREPKAQGYIPQNIHLQPTIACAMAAMQKNGKMENGAAVYQDFCSSLHIPTVPYIMETFVEKPAVSAAGPVVFNDAIYKKEPFWKGLPKGVKIGSVAVLACLVVGGVGFGVYKLKPELFHFKKGLDTSEVVSVVEDPLSNITTRKKKATTTYATDENGNKIVPTIKVATQATKHEVGNQRTTRTTRKGASGGGALDNRQSRFKTQRITRARSTSIQRASRLTRGSNSGGSDGSAGYGGGPTRASGRATTHKATAYRPTVATTAAGSKQDSGSTNGYQYVVYSNGTHITKYSGSGAVSIPSSLGGKNVTAIEASAFAGTGITSVTIPSSCSVIGQGAFKGCSSLKSVTMNGGVLSVDGMAFQNCTSLTTINWSSRLQSIGSQAFSGCSSLKNVTLPTSVQSVYNSAFKNCTSLTKVVLSPKMHCVENNTFYGCTGLSSIEIYGNMAYIGGGALYNCNALKDVYFHGTKAEWDATPNEQDVTNRALAKATIHFV